MKPTPKKLFSDSSYKEEEQMPIEKPRTIEERVSNLEIKCKHLITAMREKQSIGMYECAQEGTLTQIKSDLQKGDEMIQHKFTEVKKQIQELDTNLEKRKTENGYQNQKLNDGSNAFDEIYTILGKFNTRLSQVEGKLNLMTWFMGGTTGAIIFYVGYIVLKDFLNF